VARGSDAKVLRYTAELEYIELTAVYYAAVNKKV